MVVEGVEEDRVQAGRGGAGDVHRDRVADVADALPVDAGEVGGGEVEDARVGLGHADHVAVDDTAHRHAVARPDLADPGPPEHGLDLPDALETTPSGSPPASSAASAAMLSGIGQRQSAAMRAWPSTAAASSTSPSVMPIDRTYARSYSRQSRSSAPWADFTAIAA